MVEGVDTSVVGPVLCCREIWLQRKVSVYLCWKYCITIKYEYFYVVNLQTYCYNNCFCIFMFGFYLQKQRIVKLF